MDFDHVAAGIGGTVFFLPGTDFGCRGGEGCVCGRYAGWGLGGGLRVSSEGAGDEEDLIWKGQSGCMWFR